MTASDTDLIRDSIVVETAVGWTPECLDEGPAMLERFHASGFSMLGLTIGADWDKTDPTMHHFARERARFEREPDRFKLVESVDDIHAAKAAGKLGIAFHFQGAGPLGYDPRLIAPFYRLGIRWMILAYNVRNPLGDGCHEPSNAGLSMLGAAFVREMNRVGMIIDASHAGKRTSLDIIAASEKPVFFSHSNARALCDHERNIDDEQIRAVGERGGMIGVNSIGAFVSADGRSGPDLIANHIDHIVQLIGPEHVGLGLDVVFYQDFMLKLYDSGPMMAARGYPRPPWDDIKPEALPALVAALRSRGYDDTTLRNILGGNFLRIAAANWT